LWRLRLPLLRACRQRSTDDHARQSERNENFLHDQTFRVR
jgi:hypothetical protein